MNMIQVKKGQAPGMCQELNGFSSDQTTAQGALLMLREGSLLKIRACFQGIPLD